MSIVPVKENLGDASKHTESDITIQGGERKHSASESPSRVVLHGPPDHTGWQMLSNTPVVPANEKKDEVIRIFCADCGDNGCHHCLGYAGYLDQMEQAGESEVDQPEADDGWVTLPPHCQSCQGCGTTEGCELCGQVVVFEHTESDIAAQGHCNTCNGRGYGEACNECNTPCQGYCSKPDCSKCVELPPIPCGSAENEPSDKPNCNTCGGDGHGEACDECGMKCQGSCSKQDCTKCKPQTECLICGEYVRQTQDCPKCWQGVLNYRAYVRRQTQDCPKYSSVPEQEPFGEPHCINAFHSFDDTGTCRACAYKLRWADEPHCNTCEGDGHGEACDECGMKCQGSCRPLHGLR